MHVLRRAICSGGQHLGDVIPVSQLRAYANLVPHFSPHTDSQLTSFNSSKHCCEFFLNKYIDKNTYYAMSVYIPWWSVHMGSCRVFHIVLPPLLSMSLPAFSNKFHTVDAIHNVKSGSSPGQSPDEFQTNSGSRGRGRESRGWPRPGITPGARETNWVQRQRSSVDPLRRFQSDRGIRDQE